LGKEEEIALLNFGGIRSGTDVAKALAINCNASVFGLAPALAMGGVIVNRPGFSRTMASAASTGGGLDNWIKATSQETAIIARCTGKTSVHNLEPEDMRCISIATAGQSGFPWPRDAIKREGF
jgi:glutamate synthase (NADPH/NADH) large chain